MSGRFIYSLFIISAIISGVLYSKDYKGAELRTSASFTYGRFEVNYKASHGAGQTSTFFTYHELGSAGTAEWNEIDIEMLGRYYDDIQFNPITPGQINHEHHQWVGFDPTAEFHTYAIEWTPAYVAWFIDGEEVHRQTGAHIEALDRNQKIMMNIWQPAYPSWVGTLDTRMFPFFAYYDWVSYASYTPGSGDVGTDNNFSLQWRDDFDSWNTSRWAKATHTWDGNNCDFIPENCVFRDGKMILCLTNASQTGYVDYIDPSVIWVRYDADTITVKFSEEINRESAEDPGHYNVSNATIVDAGLDSDSRTVELAVTDFDEELSHNLIVSGITDISAIPNPLVGQVVLIQMPPAWEYPLKINVGGSHSGEWFADQGWSDNLDYGVIGGTTGQFSGQSISGTTDQMIYQSERWGLVKYQVRLPKGKYTITLMMAENYFAESGRRLFDINLEGHYIIRNLDLFNEAGIHSAYTITVEDVKVSDGMLDIHFGNNLDNALLNGLIIDRAASGVGNSNSSFRENFRLRQNFPNPFNRTTTICYELPVAAYVSLNIFDIRGVEVATLINENCAPGNHHVEWQAPVPSGIYFYKIITGNNDDRFSDIRKMILLK